MESESKGWTNEKHSSFLDSMEATFVDQLYRSEELVGWLSRWKNPTNSYENDSPIDQFKVQRQGCWNTVRCGRSNYGADRAKNNSNSLANNPWIQRFVSKSAGNAVNRQSNDIVGGAKELAESPVQEENQGIEASGQNFIDGELGVKKTPCRMSKKRRLRSSASSTVLPAKHQVVSTEQAKTANTEFGDIRACLDQENQKQSGKALEGASNFDCLDLDRHSDAESLVFKDRSETFQDLVNFQT